jgi:RNA polymerase sigma factor (sigma-70 family)
LICRDDLNTIVGDRASPGAEPGQERAVNSRDSRGGYQGVSATETAASPNRSPAPTPETCRPVVVAAMENREFDYSSLVRPMESRMMRSIWRIVRQREAAEDALQDALAVIWKKRDAVARHPNPQALILKISMAAAYDAVRKNRRRLRHEISGLPGEPADDSAAPAGKESEDRSLRAAILEAIGQLPKRQATAVLLRIIEERPYAEVARAMDCSETTVRVQVMRARAALARRLAALRPDLAVGGEGARKEDGQ